MTTISSTWRIDERVPEQQDRWLMSLGERAGWHVAIDLRRTPDGIAERLSALDEGDVIEATLESAERPSIWTMASFDL